MAVESQFDAWRKDIIANLRKAAEAGSERDEELHGEMTPGTRMTLALAAADATGQVMIAERLGQLTSGLLNEDETVAAAIQRARSGEQILGNLLRHIEDSGYDLKEDAETLVALAEDWLEPDGPVTFTTPEAVETGADAFSREEVDAEDVPDTPEDGDEELVEDDGEAEQGS